MQKSLISHVSVSQNNLTLGFTFVYVVKGLCEKEKEKSLFWKVQP